MASKNLREEEEPRFRVSDRRRVRPDAAGETAEGPQEPAAGPREPAGPPRPEPPEEGEAEKELGGPLLPIPELVQLFIAELQSRALMHMGLLPDPTTHLVARDLPQARMAIDCIAALVEQLVSSAGPAERAELEDMLAALQFHFVQQGRA